jgi:hypothetical protein
MKRPDSTLSAAARTVLWKLRKHTSTAQMEVRDLDDGVGDAVRGERIGHRRTAV